MSEARTCRECGADISDRHHLARYCEIHSNSQTKPSARPSMRAAINRHCKDCIYDPLAGGTWRQQVEACTFTDCALYPLRPVSSGGDSANP